jgi:hypothetical protein
VATNGTYSVTVTVAADDGSEAASRTFEWSVSDKGGVNTGSPISKSVREGDSVYFHVRASDPVGNTLTYSATGLPPGLEIDAATGVISGTVAAGAALGGSSNLNPGNYAAIVTVLGGVEPTSQSVFLNVVA